MLNKKKSEGSLKTSSFFFRGPMYRAQNRRLSRGKGVDMNNAVVWEAISTVYGMIYSMILWHPSIPAEVYSEIYMLPLIENEVRLSRGVIYYIVVHT